MANDWTDQQHQRRQGWDKRRGLGRRIMLRRRRANTAVSVERRIAGERRDIFARRSGSDRRGSA
jgi:hypothetical protein